MDLEQLIQLLIKEKGGTKEQYHLLLNTISNHESKGDSTIHQIGGGPGRGLYQFEVGDNRGGKTASNRLINYLKENGKQIPRWLKETSKNKSIDASTMTSEQQSMMFLGNMRKHPKANFSNIWNGKETMEDFWVKYHWAGSKQDEFKRRKSFEANDKARSSDYNIITPMKDVRESELKNLIKPKDGINVKQFPKYNLDLNKFNFKQHKVSQQEIQQPSLLNIDELNNRNVAAQGGTLNSKDPIGEFNTFNKGGKHEENPYGGIPQGVGENGKVNTVEEKETSYQFKEGKYIFSERLNLNGLGFKKHSQFANGGDINGPCGGKGQPPCPDITIKKDNINMVSNIIKPRLASPKSFLDSYINSDNYKNKLKSSNYKNIEEEILKRSNNVKNVDIINQKGTFSKIINKLSGKRISNNSNYDNDNNNIVINNKQLKKYNVNYNAILSHELAHSEINNFKKVYENSSYKDSRMNINDTEELYNRLRKKPYSMSHDYEPNENKADLNALRYQLYKEKIYDSTKDNDIKLEHLNKLQNSFIKKRLKINYKNEDIIWLLNNIASTNKKYKNIT